MKTVLKLIGISLLFINIPFINTSTLSYIWPDENKDEEFIKLLTEQINLEEYQYCNQTMENKCEGVFPVSHQLLHKVILLIARSQYNDYVHFLVKKFLDTLTARPLETYPPKKVWDEESMLKMLDKIKRTISKTKKPRFYGNLGGPE